METLVMGLGVVALVPAILILLVATVMWSAWWLHPLWAVVMVPLGLPQIGYWQFVALAIFVRNIGKTGVLDNNAKEQDEDKKRSNVISYFLGCALVPPMLYWFIRWSLS